MRTVEQIKKELEIAKAKEVEAAKARQRLEDEMMQIFVAAKNALGITDNINSQGHLKLLPTDIWNSK